MNDADFERCLKQCPYEITMQAIEKLFSDTKDRRAEALKEKKEVEKYLGFEIGDIFGYPFGEKDKKLLFVVEEGFPFIEKDDLREIFKRFRDQVIGYLINKFYKVDES